MNEGIPSLARQALVIATIVLSTLLFIAAFYLAFGFHSEDEEHATFRPPLTVVSSFLIPAKSGLFYAVSAFVPSLLLARFARVRRLWHAVILAVVAFVLLGLCLVSPFMERLHDLVSVSPKFADNWRDFPNFVCHAAGVAVLLGAYGRIVRHPLRGTSPPDAEPTVIAPPEPREPWNGTRAEWRTFFVHVASVTFLGGALCIAYPEMQRRQIPAPVWALIRDARDLEFLTLDTPALHPNAELIHDWAIVGRVSRSTPPERAALASCLRRSLPGSPSRVNLNMLRLPVYAIRVTGETKTYDLFVAIRAGEGDDHGTLQLYEGNKGFGTLFIFGPFTELEAMFAPPPPVP